MSSCLDNANEKQALERSKNPRGPLSPPSAAPLASPPPASDQTPRVFIKSLPEQRKSAAQPGVCPRPSGAARVTLSDVAHYSIFLPRSEHGNERGREKRKMFALPYSG